MDLDQLIDAHNSLVASCRIQKADLRVQQLLIEALLLALPPEGRATVEGNFKALSEQFLANGLVYSKDPTGKALDAFEEAVQRQVERFASLRSGQ